MAEGGQIAQLMQLLHVSSSTLQAIDSNRATPGQLLQRLQLLQLQVQVLELLELLELLQLVEVLNVQQSHQHASGTARSLQRNLISGLAMPALTAHSRRQSGGPVFPLNSLHEPMPAGPGRTLGKSSCGKQSRQFMFDTIAVRRC